METLQNEFHFVLWIWNVLESHSEGAKNKLGKNILDSQGQSILSKQFRLTSFYERIKELQIYIFNMEHFQLFESKQKSTNLDSPRSFKVNS